MAVGYYLSSEGTGPAFNVEHGVEVAGELHTWEGRLWRMIRAGEFIPQLDPDSCQPVPARPIFVGVKLSEWHEGADLVYWTRFENLLGERFEVRNFPDPTRPAEFRHLSAAPLPVPERTWPVVDGLFGATPDLGHFSAGREGQNARFRFGLRAEANRAGFEAMRSAVATFWVY